jgi:hypothetical protein
MMKFKWNWGTKLMLAMIFFIGLLVVLAVLSTRHSIMLVENDYYPKGLKYQERLDEISNAAPYQDKVTIEQTSGKVLLSFPKIKADSGSIVFYRPSDNTKDRVFPIFHDTITTMSIPADAFSTGKYQVKIFWKKDEKAYFIEKPFYFK